MSNHFNKGRKDQQISFTGNISENAFPGIIVDISNKAGISPDSETNSFQAIFALVTNTF